MYLLICYHFIEMLLAPSYQSRKCWHQRFACLCQGILHSGWNLRIDLTMNEMALLQILQRLRKHLLRTIRHQTTDLVKAQYTSLAGVKHVEHQHGPLITKTTHYLPDRTGQILCFDICHNHWICRKDSANRMQSSSLELLRCSLFSLSLLSKGSKKLPSNSIILS